MTAISRSHLAEMPFPSIATQENSGGRQADLRNFRDALEYVYHNFPEIEDSLSSESFYHNGEPLPQGALERDVAELENAKNNSDDEDLRTAIGTILSSENSERFAEVALREDYDGTHRPDDLPHAIDLHSMRNWLNRNSADLNIGPQPAYSISWTEAVGTLLSELGTGEGGVGHPATETSSPYYTVSELEELAGSGGPLAEAAGRVVVESDRLNGLDVASPSNGDHAEPDGVISANDLRAELGLLVRS